MKPSWPRCFPVRKESEARQTSQSGGHELPGGLGVRHIPGRRRPPRPEYTGHSRMGNEHWRGQKEGSVMGRKDVREDKGMNRCDSVKTGREIHCSSKDGILFCFCWIKFGPFGPLQGYGM